MPNHDEQDKVNPSDDTMEKLAELGDALNDVRATDDGTQGRLFRVVQFGGPGQGDPYQYG